MDTFSEQGDTRPGFVILQGTGTKRTGRTLSGSNAAESQICGAKPCVLLSAEGIVYQKNKGVARDMFPFAEAFSGPGFPAP